MEKVYIWSFLASDKVTIVILSEQSESKNLLTSLRCFDFAQHDGKGVA